MILQITMIVDDELRPTQKELANASLSTELEYWINLIYSDPPMMLDGATFELNPPIETVLQSLKAAREIGDMPKFWAAVGKLEVMAK